MMRIPFEIGDREVRKPKARLELFPFRVLYSSPSRSLIVIYRFCQIWLRKGETPKFRYKKTAMDFRSCGMTTFRLRHL